MEILLMIDVQNDFIDGALGTKEAQDMVERLSEHLDKFHYDYVVMTIDTHDENYLETREGKMLPVPHCIKGEVGWLTPDKILSKIDRKNLKIVRKDMFMSTNLQNVVWDACVACVNCWSAHNEIFDMEMKDLAINVVGLCTDICVLSNVVSLFFNLSEINENIKIRVLSEFCAGSTPEKHQYSLEILKGLGIEVV
jgi:nicotinamidase-related amidase